MALLRRLLCPLLLLVAGVMPLTAQEPVRATGPSALDPANGPGPAPIVSRAAPRSFLVVEVPVPADVPRSSSVRYVVEPAGAASMIGRVQGILPPADNAAPGGPRSVLVTFSIPRHAPAGLIEVARVRFAMPDGSQLEVPVTVAIDPVHEVQLTLGETLRGVKAGERFALTYRVLNRSNTAETVDVRAILPPGWRVESGSRIVRLGSSGTAVGQFLIAVPAETPIGAQAIRLLGLVDGQPLATVDVTVDVVGGAAGRANGPQLAAITTFGWDPSGAMASGTTVTAHGHLTDSIQVELRGTSAAAGSPAASYALAQAGFYQSAPMFALLAPRWRVGLGLTAMQFSELAGIGLNGIGMSAGIDRGAWRLSLLAARPTIGTRADSGVLAGGRLDVTTARGVTISGTVTHLEDRRGEDRRLDAVTIGAGLPDVFAGALSAEVGARWAGDGPDAGLLVRYGRRTSRGALSLQVTHAPGGSRAFARATDAVVASVARTLSRSVALSGSFASTRDQAGSVFGTLQSTNWSAGPQLQLSRSLALGVAARYASFLASSSTTGFRSSDAGLDAFVSWHHGVLYATTTSSLGQSLQETSIASGARRADRSTHLTANAILGASSPIGTFELSAHLDQHAAGTGGLPRQAEVAARADQVPLLRAGGVRIEGAATVRRTFASGVMDARTYVSADLTAALPTGFTVGMTAQRNPFLLMGTTAGRWLVGVKVGHALSLPRLASGEPRGTVFLDQDGDGTWDREEPGVAGVLVRRGAESTVTDQDGGFRFAGTTSDSIVVDPSSLRTGLLVGETRREGRQTDIAIMAVAPVEVSVTQAAEDLVRADSTVMASVVVLARDEAGHVWVSRRSSASSVVFDALPVGQYAIELDLADVTVPLEVHGGLPRFVVSGARPTERPRVVLFARPVRVKQFEARPSAAAPGAKR